MTQTLQARAAEVAKELRVSASDESMRKTERAMYRALAALITELAGALPTADDAMNVDQASISGTNINMSHLRAARALLEKLEGRG